MVATTPASDKTKTKAAPEAEAETAFAGAEFELPKSAREFAERGLDETRKAYDRIKDATEEAASTFESSAAKVADTATDFNLRNIDYAKSHLDATFELTRKLLKTRDFGEAMELQADFTRARIDAANAHAKALGEWSAKAAQEATEPLKTQAAKGFESFRSFIPV